MNNVFAPYRKCTNALRADNRFRSLREITILSPREALWDGKTYLNFSSNNYLGLTHHPMVIARSREYLETYGAGSGASQLVSGNGGLHWAIEQKIAKCKGSEAAILFASGFQANASVLSALLDKKILKSEPLVFSDKLNHASIHEGCALAQTKQIRYQHNNLDALETQLKKHQEVHATRFILSETVFSMDGDIADVAGLSFLAQKYGAILYLDEAHSTGILGKNGFGLAQDLGTSVPWVAMGTFSKALGASGAYVACTQDVRDFLVNKALGFIYTTAIPPAILGAVDAALDIVPQMNAERKHLSDLSFRVRKSLSEMGFQLLGAETPILPVILGADERALKAFESLLQRGILAVPIRPPTVPNGTSRLRITLSAAHSLQDVDSLILGFAQSSW